MAELERGVVAADLGAGGEAGLVEAIGASPAPGLLLSPERVILAHNGALTAWLGGSHAPLLQAPLAAHFQIRPPQVFTRAAEALAEGRRYVAPIQLVFAAPGRVSLAAGRLVALRRGGAADGAAENGGRGYYLIWLTLGAARPPTEPRPGGPAAAGGSQA